MKIDKLIIFLLTRVAVGHQKQTLADGRIVYYVRQNKELNFQDAYNWCSSKGGTLPKPINRIENDFLESLGSTWLGFSVDEAEKWSYKNWGKGEPNKKETDGNRVQLLVGWNYFSIWGGTWNDGPSKIQSTCYIKELTGSPLPQLNGTTTTYAANDMLPKFTCTSNTGCIDISANLGPHFMCKKNYKHWRGAAIACQLYTDCIGLLRYKTGGTFRWELLAKVDQQNRQCKVRNNMASFELFFARNRLVEMQSYTHELPNKRSVKFVRTEHLLSHAESANWCNDELKGSLPIPLTTGEEDFLVELGSSWMGLKRSEMSTLPYEPSSIQDGPNAPMKIIDRIIGRTWSSNVENVGTTCYVSESNRALKRNSYRTGCLQNEYCSAAWKDRSTMICSGKYSTLRFAQTTCQMSPSCDGIFEVKIQSVTHWELFSNSTSPCAYVGEVPYTTKLKHEHNIQISTNNDGLALNSSPMSASRTNMINNIASSIASSVLQVAIPETFADIPIHPITPEPLEPNAISVNSAMNAGGVSLSCASNSRCGDQNEVEISLMCKDSFKNRSNAIAACNRSKNCIGLLKYVLGNETKYEVITIGHGQNKCPFTNQNVTQKSLLYRQYF